MQSCLPVGWRCGGRAVSDAAATVTAVRPLGGLSARSAAVLGLAVAMAASLAVACAATGVPEVPKDAVGLSDPVLELGRNVYIKRCVACHGRDGTGIRGRALGQGAVLEAYPEITDQIAVVSYGYRAGMPSFEEVLTPEQIMAVVLFTRKIL